MCRPFSSTTFSRWSASSRWIGLRPTTPSTGPLLPRTSTRWPTRICGSQPPTGANQRKPFSSMWVTISPISSMWPTTASSGAASPTVAIEEPMPSVVSSAKEAASRQTAAAGPSYPEGAPARRRLSRSAGVWLKAGQYVEVERLSAAKVANGLGMGGGGFVAKLRAPLAVAAVLVPDHRPNQYVGDRKADQRRHRRGDRDEDQQHDRQPQALAVDRVDVAVAEGDQAQQVDRDAPEQGDGGDGVEVLVEMCDRRLHAQGDEDDPRHRPARGHRDLPAG